jgi:nicotinamide-nucleotide amidase
MSRPADDAEGIARAASELRRSVAVAESLTGGTLSACLARLPNASEWYRGAVVAYSSSVKHAVLHVPPGEVVSRVAAIALADGVAELLDADLTIAVTGVGGPDSQDGEAPGTVWMALHDHAGTEARSFAFTGEPADIVQQTCDAAIGWLVDHLTEVSRRA